MTITINGRRVRARRLRVGERLKLGDMFPDGRGDFWQTAVGGVERGVQGANVSYYRPLPSRQPVPMELVVARAMEGNPHLSLAHYVSGTTAAEKLMCKRIARAVVRAWKARGEK